MNLVKTVGLFLITLCCTTILSSQPIYINEFMASNEQTIADENGEFDDWVEFYNAGNLPYDLGGKFVTDDLAEPNQWQIPTTNPSLTTIPPSGYLIIWFDGEEEQGELHVSPKLGGGGEQIGLYDADGMTPIDTLTYEEQTSDISEGRFPDGNSNFVKFTEPTPGSTNLEPAQEVVAEPIFLQLGGLYNSSISLTLTNETVGATIYYTTDGSDPDENSLLYTNPISINTSQVIRATGFKAGATASEIITNSYLINTNHTFPIVSISGNPDKFFGEENGLFPNYEIDVEVPLNVEFYETDGTQGFNQAMEVEIQGSASAILPQKSLAMKAKGSLGNKKIEYPVFPNESLDEYRSLMLRNSGQDWEYTMFRDALESTLVADLSDLAVSIDPLDLDDQAYRPAIAYLNGEYWGIYNLRERSDKRYIKNRYDLDDDEIDLLENLDEAKEGDFVEWLRMDSILRSKTFTDDAGLAELADFADIGHYMDYILHNVFIDNTDWPGNNFLRWRERSADGKWRFMTKDLDYGFGFLELSTNNFNTGNPNVNSLDRILNPTFFFPNPDWATLLFNRLIENPKWKRDFINRMADQLNVLFSKERILNKIDEFQATYQPEVNQHNQMWQNIWTWNQDVDVLRTFANARTEAVRGHFTESFREVTGTSEVTVSALPANGGVVKISTITTNEAAMPWTGTYFNGVEVPIQAIANEGYKFAGWSANVQGGENTTITLNGAVSIVAIFVPDDGTGGPSNQFISFPGIGDKLVTDAPFQVTATASSGLPINLEIISGPATINGNTVSLNGTVGTVSIQASQAGDGEYNAAPTASQSFEVTDFIDPPNEFYCDSRGEQPWEEYIASVQFQEINNTSGKNNYGNFLNQTATVNRTENYPISLTPDFSWAQYNETFTVWIDWNQDNDFEDVGEQAYTGNLPAGINGTPASPLVGIISVPADAAFGTTRMRVTMQRNQATESCGDFTLGETEDYTILVAEGTVSNLTLNCTEPIVVNTAPEATGAIINWENPTANTLCPSGINEIVQINGQISGSFFPLGSSIVTYSATDNCGNTATCNFEIIVTESGSYCEAIGNQPWEEYIANVSLNTIDNNSFKERYEDFTNITATLERGTTYDIDLTPGFSYFQWDEAFQVWIDYNGNGSFEDDGELVYSGIYVAQAPGSTPPTLSGTFTLPNSVQPINTRMRIAMQRNTHAEPCGAFEFGEVEDYSVQIIQGNNSNNSRASYLNFAAFNAGRAVELQWLTNALEEVEYFTLERSSDGENFQPLIEVNQLGENQLDAFFRKVDIQPLVGENYYRLKQHFIGGETGYSPTQLVKFYVDLGQVNAFPNPAKDLLNIQLSNFGGQSGTLQLFDAFGRLQRELKMEVLPNAILTIPLTDLSNGLYYVKLLVNNQQAFNKKVIVNRLY